MVNLNDIHPMTGFLRDHKAHLERLRETGRPEVLTVNGTARVVVQDVASYQKMLEVLDYADAVKIIRERLGSLDAGEPGVPLDQVLEEMQKRIGIKSS